MRRSRFAPKMLCASIDQRTRRHRHLAGARRHESERQGPPRATFPSRGGTRTDAGGVAGVSERVSNRHAASHVSSGWARLPGRRPNNRSRLRPRLPNGQPDLSGIWRPDNKYDGRGICAIRLHKNLSASSWDYGPGVELLLVLIRYPFHLISLLDSQPSRVTSLSSAPHPLRQHGPREEW